MSERLAIHRPDSAMSRIFTKPPVWMDDAACADPTLNPDSWFPDNGSISEVVRRVCRGCPIRPECLEAGLYEKHGVWGGLSEPERATLTGRYVRAPATPASPVCVNCGATFPNARSRAGHQPYCRKTNR